MFVIKNNEGEYWNKGQIWEARLNPDCFFETKSEAEAERKGTVVEVYCFEKQKRPDFYTNWTAHEVAMALLDGPDYPFALKNEAYSGIWDLVKRYYNFERRT